MQLINIQEVKPNENNPRFIKDYKFKKLVKSIKESPTFMQLNTLKLDEDFTLLAGNMRYRACKELGWNQVPVNIFTRDMAEKNNKERLAIGLKETTYEEQCKELIIKDNVSFGEWDWDLLANDWNGQQVEDWGLTVVPFEDSIEEVIEQEIKKQDKKINTCEVCGKNVV